VSDEQEKEPKQERSSPIVLADQFLQSWGMKGDESILVYWREDFYRWEDGVYRKIDRDTVKTRMTAFLVSMANIPTRELVDTLWAVLKMRVYLLPERVLNTWLNDSKTFTEPVRAVTMENGIVLFQPDGTVKFQEATPNFFSVVKLPYAFDAKAECPRWDQFLKEVTKGDEELIKLLQQWAGYLLTPSNRFQCFLLCLGDAGAGKGTFVTTMTSMLGTENCSGVPIRRFSDRFALSETYGKVLNVAGDAEEEITPQTEGLIKEWTGEDPTTYERKYSAPFTAKATAKLIISANSRPTFTDKSNGTWRRLQVVPFQRENLEVMDTHLRETLQAELPGVLNWAIRGLHDLETMNAFVVPERSIEVWKDYKEWSNPGGRFLKENYSFDCMSAGIPTQVMYQTYRDWSRARGYIPMSDTNFGREVFRAFPQAKKARVGSGRDGIIRVYTYTGLTLNVDAEIRNPEMG
jgi:P4 family phage/plasmid primase-like protien